MRIFLIGQAAFGQDVFTRLREAGEEIVAVAAPAQSLSGRADRLWAAADAAGVPAFELGGLDNATTQAAVASLAPQLGVMAFVSELIPTAVLDLPEHGTIQYHPSLLPRHRGRSSINWAIIEGDRTTGVSIFWPDEGLDTGPLLLQREVEIGDDDTTGSIYYDKLYPLGLDMFVEAVALVAAGGAPRTAQDESKATYERPCTEHLVRVDWRRPAVAVYDLIRGADPSPAAWTRHAGRKLRLLDARLRPPVDAGAGVIASLGDEGMLVGGSGGALLIRKLQGEEGDAAAAAAFAAANGLAVGERFLNPVKP